MAATARKSRVGRNKLTLLRVFGRTIPPVTFIVARNDNVSGMFSQSFWRLEQNSLIAGAEGVVSRGTRLRKDQSGVLFPCYHRDFMAKIHALSLSMGARICPLCGCKDVLRSQRRGVLEWTILLLLLLRPFRCRQCSARHAGFFFRPRRVKDSEIVAARDID